MRQTLLPSILPRRRRAAALVEFTVCFIMLFALILGLLELCRALNMIVTLNTVAAATARWGAVDDPLSEISNADVRARAVTEMARFGFDTSRLYTEANINYLSPLGNFHTRVRVIYRMPTVFFPISLNGNGYWSLSSTVVRPNDVQAFRPNAGV